MTDSTRTGSRGAGSVVGRRWLTAFVTASILAVGMSGLAVGSAAALADEAEIGAREPADDVTPEDQETVTAGDGIVEDGRQDVPAQEERVEAEGVGDGSPDADGAEDPSHPVDDGAADALADDAPAADGTAAGELAGVEAPSVSAVGSPDAGETGGDAGQTLADEETGGDAVAQDVDDEPRVEVWPEALDEFAMAYSGLTITGDGLDPGAEASVFLDDDLVVSLIVAESGELQASYSALLVPGAYVLSVVSGDLQHDHAFTVHPGGFDPQLGLSIADFWGENARISEWEVGRQGFVVEGSGYAPGIAVTVAIGEDVIGEAVVGEYGTFSLAVAAELPVGAHVVTATSVVGDASAEFTVVADDEFYDEEPGDLRAVASWQVVTVSEVAGGLLTVEALGFPGDASLELYLDDELIAAGVTETTGWRYVYAFEELSPGDYTVTWRHAVGSASTTFVVVPDEQGAPPPAGAYAGQADLGGGTSVPLTFDVDGNGVLSNFSAPRTFVCVGYEGIPTDPFEFDWDLPPTPVTVGQPFEIRWGLDADDISYVVYGVIESDGTAHGEARWLIPCHGAIHDHWVAQTDVEGSPTPTPEPTPTPTPTPEPTPTPTPETPSAEDLTDAARGTVSVPAEAPEGTTITVSVGQGLAGTQVWAWLFSSPVLLGSPTVDADGTITLRLPAGVSGEHRIAVYDSAGALIGWGPIAIVAAQDAGADDPDGRGGDDGVPSPTPSDSPPGLAVTGTTPVPPVLALALLAIGAVMWRTVRVRAVEMPRA